MILLNPKKIAKPFFSSREYFSAGPKLREEKAIGLPVPFCDKTMPMPMLAPDTWMGQSEQEHMHAVRGQRCLSLKGFILFSPLNIFLYLSLQGCWWIQHKPTVIINWAKKWFQLWYCASFGGFEFCSKTVMVYLACRKSKKCKSSHLQLIELLLCVQLLT